MENAVQTIDVGSAGFQPAPSINRAAEFRRAFDEAFAQPAVQTALETESLLAIRAAGDPFALRVRELAGLARSGNIVAVPSPAPALLGIMELRGGILPVFNLAALLGYGIAGDSLRWVAVCGASHRLGLAFAEFESCFQASLSDISVVEEAQSRHHSREIVRTAGAVRPIVSIPSILRGIKTRDQHKER